MKIRLNQYNKIIEKKINRVFDGRTYLDVQNFTFKLSLSSLNSFKPIVEQSCISSVCYFCLFTLFS